MLQATSLIANSTSATLDVTALFSDLLCSRIRACFVETFDKDDPQLVNDVCDVAQIALTHIGHSDALYHNIEHTVHVTLVGLAILRGKQIRDDNVRPHDWANAVTAMLCHDIGFVRGLLPEDQDDFVATGVDGETVHLSEGGTDAKLMPLHVDRGKVFTARQFSKSSFFDVSAIQANIERTRFPVPGDPAYQVCDDFPGLVRAADLIGQLSDLRYLSKLGAVFFEFEEIGLNGARGYREPGDLIRNYPNFFQSSVEPYLSPALDYLRQTTEGREVVTQLYANLELARRLEPEHAAH